MKTTFGQRIRQARRERGLSQAELAKQLSQVTKAKTHKALVSQWELDKIANPNNSTMLALQAILGKNLQWLVSGKGPENVALPKLMVAEERGVYGRGMTRDSLRRSILIACAEHTVAERIADASIEVVETLADEPDIPDAVLHRIARLSAPRTKG